MPRQEQAHQNRSQAHGTEETERATIQPCFKAASCHSLFVHTTLWNFPSLR